MTECSKPIEIDAGEYLRALTFSTNGEYLVSGHEDGVRVWRGKHCMATMEAKGVECVAVSKDGRWIAAGTLWGEVCGWDATTHKRAFKFKDKSRHPTIHGVDFSPDSKRLVTASRTATVWDVHTGKQMQILPHEHCQVVAAKCSTWGDRIATATEDHVRLWDGEDGSLLVDIPVEVIPWCNTGLVWSNDHLFVTCKRAIKELDTRTGSTVSEWRVPDANIFSSIVLPKHGAFIAYAKGSTVTFWDTSTHSEIAQIQHSENVRSIAISPDDRSIAIGGQDGNVVIETLSRIIGSIPSSRLRPTLQEPAIQVDAAALEAWQHDRLDSAEALLDAVIAASSIPNHHALASRALVRARLTRWDDALADVKKAIDAQPSVISYIAKSIAHVGNGDRHKAYRSCDIAIERFHSSHVTFLLLVKSIIMFMAGEHLDAISRVDDLISVYPFISVFYGVQACGHYLSSKVPLTLQQAHMLLLRGNSLMACSNYEDAIQAFKRARAQLTQYSTQPLFVISLISGWKFDNLDITIRQCLCEALYSAGHMMTARKSLLEVTRTFEDRVYSTENTVKWVSDFTQRCLTIHGSDTTSDATHDAQLLMFHTSLLRQWAKATLATRPWKDALASAIGFIVPMFAIYRVICEHLDAMERITDATECLFEMISQEADEQTEWTTEFKHRLSRKLEEYGDAAMNARRHDEAIGRYSAALSLNCNPLQALLGKRSKARANMGLWKDAIDDANQLILLDPSSPLGYERKHAASLGAGCYGDAEVAFETMLSKMSGSPNAEIRERSRRYVKPMVTKAAIRKAIQAAIHESPPFLINTYSGCLLDKPGQASSFESRTIFRELVSSTTTCINHSRIQDEVSHYYRYAMFSHNWKAKEPLFDDVIHVVVYDFEQSPTHDKLKRFCKIVREAGLHWAWSDTCCINKLDPSALQEALVSMFRWYQSSTLTVVLLCDVPLRRLSNSVWNSRAWTFQEYHASKVVQFYNKDWSLYKNLDMPNHKESPEIIAEMEEATGISAQALTALRPGLEDIREKLRLASTRQATRIEDAAYSLLGIFSLSMPIEYGEGDRALGRLLAQLLASSGDTSILAWTGKSGSFNSCLPSKIAVFNLSATSHIPSPITSGDIEMTTTGLREASQDLASLMILYNRLNDLPVPQFSGKRMKLPSIVFKLGPLSVSRSGVFRARTCVLGVVEIKTDEDLSRFNSLVLVHPWIDFLPDRQPVGGVIETLSEGRPRASITKIMPETDTEDLSCSTGEPSSFTRSDATTVDRITITSPPFSHGWSATGTQNAAHLTSTPDTLLYRTPSDTSRATSLLPPSTLLETEREMNALRVMARLKQPFGALLLASDSGNVAAYKRVATETLITVQVEEMMTPTMLDKLIRDVDVLDVL